MGRRGCAAAGGIDVMADSRYDVLVGHPDTLRICRFAIVGWALGPFLGGCSDVRSQLVVYVDTDAPLSAQVVQDRELSYDAAMDTLRIDRLDEDSSSLSSLCLDDSVCVQHWAVPDAASWPVSFGVATPGDGPTRIYLRLRLFRSDRSVPGYVGDTAISDPFPSTTIDRLVALDLPDAGISQVGIFLHADCINTPVSFLGVPTTCVDVERRESPPSEGVELDAAPTTTLAGTWELARSTPCASTLPPGATCIAGGFSVMGEVISFSSPYLADTTPLRPIWLPPYFMDRTEVTVGRLRQLVLAGKVSVGPKDFSIDPLDNTWLGPDDPTNDALPLASVTWSAARRICEAAGGMLPTEAQWEHAARGRGEGRVYPWGNRYPDCCTASLAHLIDGGCPGSTPEPAGSHPASDDCAGGIGDESRDGVLDLGGSMSEYCDDKLADYDAPCWARKGVFVSPRCEEATTERRAVRGGNWLSGLGVARVSLRFGSNSGADGSLLDSRGVRCAYVDQGK